MTTTIQKWGNSQGIRIPKILLDTVEWGENEQIIILVDNGPVGGGHLSGDHPPGGALRACRLQ